MNHALTLYQEYMSEYFEEALDEMYSYLEAEGDSGKPGIYKENYYLRDNLQVPYITSVLAKSKVQDAIIEFTGKFMDDHSKELSTSGPIYIFTFGTKDAEFLYETFNITPDKVHELFSNMIVETYYGKVAKFIEGWVKNAPHKVLITAILVDAVQHGYEDIITCCEYLWAFSEYALIYRLFWKIGVKEDVMNYTIEHLGSKFQVKKVNNLRELLKYDAHSSVAAMTDRLKKGVDNVYCDIMQRMRNQIKGKFRNIANAYFDNVEKNASQHKKVSQFDDGSLSDQEGYTTLIAQTVDNTVSKIMVGGVNNALARVAADGSSVDKDNLISYLNMIMSSKNNGIPKFVENIITAFFVKNPTSTSVGDGEFVNFALALYRSISTSNDEIYKNIRQILNHWMYEIINIKEVYSREPTWIAYTRAVYNYMVWMINHYN